MKFSNVLYWLLGLWAVFGAAEEDGGGSGGGESEGDALGAGAGEGSQDALGAGEGDKGKGDKGEGGEEGDKGGAPEKYEDFSLPEGMERETLDQGLLDQYHEFAKENSFPQEMAQKGFDLYTQALQKLAEQQHNSWMEAQEENVRTTHKDPELANGGLQKNLAEANRALNQFATPDFKQLLVDTGLGKHPEMIRTWLKVSKAIGDDDVPGSGHGGGEKQGIADRLYGGDSKT